jgi:antitoxin ChpS
MHTTYLRKVGRSVMLTIPPALLEILHLKPSAKVGIAVESGRLVVEPQQCRRYTLTELLARCDSKEPRTKKSESGSIVSP